VVVYGETASNEMVDVVYVLMYRDIGKSVSQSRDQLCRVVGGVEEEELVQEPWMVPNTRTLAITYLVSTILMNWWRHSSSNLPSPKFNTTL